MSKDKGTSVVVNGADTGITPLELGEWSGELTRAAIRDWREQRAMCQGPEDGDRLRHAASLAGGCVHAMHALIVRSQTNALLEGIAGKLTELTWTIGRQACNDREQAERHHENTLGRYDALAGELKKAFDLGDPDEPIELDDDDHDPAASAAPATIAKRGREPLDFVAPDGYEAWLRFHIRRLRAALSELHRMVGGSDFCEPIGVRIRALLEETAALPTPGAVQMGVHYAHVERDALLSAVFAWGTAGSYRDSEHPLTLALLERIGDYQRALKRGQELAAAQVAAS